MTTTTTPTSDYANDLKVQTARLSTLLRTTRCFDTPPVFGLYVCRLLVISRLLSHIIEDLAVVASVVELNVGPHLSMGYSCKLFTFGTSCPPLRCCSTPSQRPCSAPSPRPCSTLSQRPCSAPSQRPCSAPSPRPCSTLSPRPCSSSVARWLVSCLFPRCFHFPLFAPLTRASCRARARARGGGGGGDRGREPHRRGPARCAISSGSLGGGRGASNTRACVSVLGWAHSASGTVVCFFWFSVSHSA